MNLRDKNFSLLHLAEPLCQGFIAQDKLIKNTADSA